MIISASRRTDIPTYYSEWFINRIKEKYVCVRNPINPQQVSRINLSPDVVDCIVFWTKNPKPFLSKLDALQDYPYYFQFTLNAYGNDIEMNMPSKCDEVIETFQRLSAKIGPEKVIWRYDPILLNQTYTIEYHTQSFEALAFRLKDSTEKCTISFMDAYPKLKTNLAPLHLQNIAAAQKREIAKNLSAICHRYGLKMATCAEDIDLNSLGIAHAKCIDDKLIERIIRCPLDVEKDKHQRPACGCVTSIDIGTYNTCRNGCRYCYANHSPSSVAKHASLYDSTAPLLCGSLTEKDTVKDRPVTSLRKNQLDLFAYRL